ncbi:MAG: biopolymer transporter ExbD [Acidobacteriota bacterium]
MAFSGMGSNSARGRGRWRTASSMSEMNVVPLVDVVLVLLIIFMVTASAMEFGLKIDVPKVKSRSTSSEPGPVVGISQEGALYLNGEKVNINELGPAIHRRFADAKEAYVRSDKNARVEQFAQVAAALGEAKIGVKLVTQPINLKK